MKDDKGKVIFSLIAGATAGIVAGLLLAPETGEETRTGLRQSVRKLGNDVSKFLKENIAKMQGSAEPLDAATAEAKAAADALLNKFSAADLNPSTVATAPKPVSNVRGQNVSNAHLPDDASADYDGFGEDIRHRPL